MLLLKVTFMQFKYEDLEDLAKEKEDENWGFRKFLKFYEDLSDDELDELVSKIADEVGSTIECTSCGRCCKELRPTLSQEDQKRLAARLELTVEQLRGKYLHYNDADDERGWRIKASPCSFHKDNKCIVYEDRPQNCRDYPYLHKSDFSYRTMGMIERTFTCPIVFTVMEELKEALEFSVDYSAEDCW
jgi:Fe-S-cluster containining protein